MNLPGFTAEASLHKTSDPFHTARTVRNQTDREVVLPQTMACIRVGLPGRRQVIVCVELPEPQPIFA